MNGTRQTEPATLLPTQRRHGGDMRRSIFRALWLAIVASTPLWPELTTTVQVDDPLYLSQANSILARPHDPLAVPPKWLRGDWFAINQNPPLWPAILAVAVRWLGWNTMALVGVAIVFRWLLALALVRLIEKVSAWPTFWATLLLWSPFWLPGQNLMADNSLWALGGWSMVWFLDALLSKDRTQAFLIAGILAGLAALAKYTALLLAPLFVLLAILFRCPRALRALFPMAFLVAGWSLSNWWLHGKSHLGAQRIDLEPGMLFDRVRVVVRAFGLLLVLTPAWLWSAWRGGRIGPWGLAGLLCLSLGAAVADGLSLTWRLEAADAKVLAETQLGFAFATANGVLGLSLLVLSLCRVEKKQFDGGSTWERMQLVRATVMGVGLGLVFNVFLTPSTPFGAVRHLNVALAPAFVLLGLSLEEGLRALRWGWLIAAPSLLASVGLAFSLAHVDARTSSAASLLFERTQSFAQERKIYFVGDPNICFLAWKANRPWLDLVEEQDRLIRGDYVAFVGSQGLGAIKGPLQQRLKIIQVWDVETRIPIRVVGPFSNFYAGGFLKLPWELAPVFSTRAVGEVFAPSRPVESIYLCEVR